MACSTRLTYRICWPRPFLENFVGCLATWFFWYFRNFAKLVIGHSTSTIDLHVTVAIDIPCSIRSKAVQPNTCLTWFRLEMNENYYMFFLLYIYGLTNFRIRSSCVAREIFKYFLISCIINIVFIVIIILLIFRSKIAKKIDSKNIIYEFF